MLTASLLEVLGLEKVLTSLLAMRSEADGNLSKTAYHDGVYLVWVARLFPYIFVVESLYGAKELSEEATQISLDAVIRNAEYVICGPPAYVDAPGNEAELHKRLEAVLRGVYPNLKTKPTLT